MLFWRFWSCGKMAWWESYFMKSQPGKETIKINILPNISRTKGHRTMKIGQSIQDNMIFFCENHPENEARRLVPDLPLFLEKALHEVKASYLHISLDFRLLIQRDSQFWFLGKGLELVSPPHLIYDFWRKMFLMLYFISWPNVVAWLPLLLEILDNLCIAFQFVAS